MCTKENLRLLSRKKINHRPTGLTGQSGALFVMLGKGIYMLRQSNSIMMDGTAILRAIINLVSSAGYHID